MDVTRVSLDKISRRPACSSRACPICRSLHTSLELLTPEPCVPKVDSPVTLAASHQRGSLEDCCPEENKGDDREKSDVRKVRTDQQTIVESTTVFLHMCILKPNELSGCIFDLDSGDDSMGTQTLEFCEPSQGKLSSAKADPSHANEDEICTSVFHTEINPEDYDCHETHHNHDYPSELERNEFLNQAENMHSKNKGNQDFIKKNVELAKDPGNQVVMLERERKRLVELLKDTEDGIEFQGLEEDLSGWLAPGEGYTPELMDFHLNEIDIKLQVLLSDGDFSAISSSCSKPSSQIYQEPLVYANRSLEAVPGEKVLRDNKEQRDQQNRLKEIDHQLKSLERNLTEEQTGLSEEQLKTLLEECMQPQRTISNVTMPKSQESLSFGLSPPCYTSQDSTLHSTSTLSKMLVEDHIVGMLMAQEKAGLGDKSLCVNAESEIPGYYISKALADSHLSKDSLAQTEEPDDLEGLQKMGDKSVTEGYFMSRALNTKRLKKPSFLGEPLYCISMNNEPSTEADILSIPLQTKGGETLNNPLEKAFDYDEKKQAGSHQRYAPIHTGCYGEARM
ncbi:fibrous sheath-interacting protein 1 isoform X4 [Falco biarmicus]|uniref:fibrous sheath-interacting protein 1 isoform X4 n=1 Tax=Falco peregrinus TaxID=8954 RepID=UPI00247AB133|nr:fibrous sheath-interacting protein 1 isoform X4 [Falco peregrinus]XP_056203005.1 fibrous sheath-interacting protein 1 isoform X4 [Falco biarmicus]